MVDQELTRLVRLALPSLCWPWLTECETTEMKNAVATDDRIAIEAFVSLMERRRGAVV